MLCRNKYSSSQGHCELNGLLWTGTEARTEVSNIGQHHIVNLPKARHAASGDSANMCVFSFIVLGFRPLLLDWNARSRQPNSQF